MCLQQKNMFFLQIANFSTHYLRFRQRVCISSQPNLRRWFSLNPSLQWPFFSMHVFQICNLQQNCAQSTISNGENTLSRGTFHCCVVPCTHTMLHMHAYTRSISFVIRIADLLHTRSRLVLFD